MTDTTFVDTLMLSVLRQGLPGLSEPWGGVLCEASSYCFEFNKHAKGVKLRVYGVSETSFSVNWDDDITDQVRAAWDDHQVLAEFGAYGVAILLVLKLTAFTVIRRARKGTGIDYWLGYKNTEEPFQNAARLEVSGILSGDVHDIRKRINKKLVQVEPTDGPLPAFIVVVEFSEPRSHLVQK